MSLLVWVFCPGCSTHHSEKKLRSDSAQKLVGVELLSKIFENEYAPANFKAEKFNWNLQSEISDLRKEVETGSANSSVGTNAAILKFFGNLRDLHSRPIFRSGKTVWLGIHIKRASGRYIIAWIDPSLTKKYLFQIGDEVVSFGGHPVGKEIVLVKEKTHWVSTPDFEQSFAEWFLTFRSTSDWPEIPQKDSPVSLELVRKKSKKRETVTMSWMDDEEHPPGERCPYWGKTKAGYLPALGVITWSAPDSHFFKSYIFRHKGQSYGFLRFHTYAPSADKRVLALAELDEVVAKFNEQKIKALVIDQTGNGGGNFVYGFSMLARLTNKPLRTPLQNYLINKERLVGFATMESLKEEVQRFSKIQTDKEAQGFLTSHPLFKDNLNFIKRDLSAIRNFQGFIDFFVKDFAIQKSRHLTSPHYQFQEWIMPSVGPHYGGPIFLLADELNLSAAEYVAATLKDSGRAKLIGVTTSGAGGDQRAITVDALCNGDKKIYEFSLCISPKEAAGLEALGLRGFTYTVTLGQRVGPDGKIVAPIENRGVQPDFEHRLTGKDITSDFSDYRRLILTLISKR